MLRTILTLAFFAGFLAATAAPAGAVDFDLMAMRSDGSGRDGRWFNAVHVDFERSFAAAFDRSDLAVPAQSRRVAAEPAAALAVPGLDAPYLSWRNARASEMAVDGRHVPLAGPVHDGFTSVASYERKCLPGGGGMFWFLFAQ